MLKSSASQTNEKEFISGLNNDLNSDHNELSKIYLTSEQSGKKSSVVGSPVMVVGRTYQASSIQALTGRPRTPGSEQSFSSSFREYKEENRNYTSSSSVNSKQCNLNNLLTADSEFFYEGDVGQTSNLDDDNRKPNTPVKTSHLSLCC